MTAKVEDLYGLPGWPALLSAEQAAAYFGISTSTFAAQVRDGRLPQPRTIGRRKLWSRTNLDQFAAGQPANDASPDHEPTQRRRQAFREIEDM